MVSMYVGVHCSFVRKYIFNYEFDFVAETLRVEAGLSRVRSQGQMERTHFKLLIGYFVIILYSGSI